MRVSERHRYAIATERMENAKLSNTDAMEIISSQKKINKLEDDPVGVTKVIKGRQSISNFKGYLNNIAFSKGFVEVSEAAISGIGDRLQRAHEISVAMANDTYGPDSREAVSKEVKEIIDEVVNLGNSNYNNRYVFAGFRNSSPAVSKDGNFLGDDGAIYMEVAEGKFRQINLEGRNLFESTSVEQEKGHFSLVTALELLKDALEGNDKVGITKSVDEIKFHLEKTAAIQANVGATWAALNASESRIEVQKDHHVDTVSKIEDADIYDATSNYKRTETALQSTLMASNKLLQPSLLNFLQ